MDKLTTSEKWKLLGALYKCGSDEDKLTKALPELKESQIAKAIKSYRARARRNLEPSQNGNSQEPIDLWFDFIDDCHRIEGTNNQKMSKRRRVEANLNNYSFLLDKSMLYAACFEEHFQGNNPDEPNYNEIYKYIAQLLAGEEPTQLRPSNAKKVVEMMSKLKNLLDNKESIQRYLNYISDQHSVSYVKPGVDVCSIVEEKKQKSSEVDSSEVAQLFNDSDSASDVKLSSLSEQDPHYLVKKNKIILKLSLKQRALAGTLSNIPGLNPLEMVLPSLVKPPITLLPANVSKSRKRKSVNSNS